PVFIRLPGFWTWPRDQIGAAAAGRRLWEHSGLGPADMDVAFFYDFFTSVVLLDLEDYGFCEYGAAGHFAEDGNLEWPNGKLPINTSGGQLSEAHNHGFNNIIEAVRQLRGTSTSQVENCHFAFVS